MSDLQQARSAWADQFLGKKVKDRNKNEGIVVRWYLGLNRRGVWLVTKTGQRTYRRFPKELKDETKA